MTQLNDRRFGQFAQRFIRDEDGAFSVLGLFLFVAMGIIGAFALDVSHLYAARTQLQVAADLVAHAALYNRDTLNEDDAKAAAIEIVYSGMPEHKYGIVLTPEEIAFGSYDPDTRIFTADDDATGAVQVMTARLAETGNPASSFLFRLIGIDNWDIRTYAIFTTFQPMCFREGFVADGIVDLQSNNNYMRGFCIHSNEFVSINSNNTFEAGTIVSMPDIADLDLPQSGFETNLGLQAALRSGAYRLRVLNRIDTLFAELLEFGSPSMPDYITDAEIIDITSSRLNTSDFVQGRIHRIACRGGKLTITPDVVLREVVIVTSCEVKFNQGAILEDVVLATTDDGAASINSPSSLQVGRNDDCAPGGGAQLISRGGMNFASDLKLFNGQLLALGDIEFSANANGLNGAAMVSAGEISGTSNMDMGLCGTGMEDNFEAQYFRLAG